MNIINQKDILERNGHTSYNICKGVKYCGNMNFEMMRFSFSYIWSSGLDVMIRIEDAIKYVWWNGNTKNFLLQIFNMYKGYENIVFPVVLNVRKKYELYMIESCFD